MKKKRQVIPKMFNFIKNINLYKIKLLFKKLYIILANIFLRLANFAITLHYLSKIALYSFPSDRAMVALKLKNRDMVWRITLFTIFVSYTIAVINKYYFNKPRVLPEVRVSKGGWDGYGIKPSRRFRCMNLTNWVNYKPRWENKKKNKYFVEEKPYFYCWVDTNFVNSKVKNNRLVLRKDSYDLAIKTLMERLDKKIYLFEKEAIKANKVKWKAHMRDRTLLAFYKAPALRSKEEEIVMYYQMKNKPIPADVMVPPFDPKKFVPDITEVEKYWKDRPHQLLLEWSRSYWDGYTWCASPKPKVKKKKLEIDSSYVKKIRDIKDYNDVNNSNIFFTNSLRLDRKTTKNTMYNPHFPNNSSDILVYLTIWQYWWWFWFLFLTVFYYVLLSKIFITRQRKFNPRINTSVKSHGKWGDFIVGLIPIYWCVNILVNSNFLLKHMEWQTESNIFTFRVRGKQWYWLYKIDSFYYNHYNFIRKTVGRSKSVRVRFKKSFNSSIQNHMMTTTGFGAHYKRVRSWVNSNKFSFIRSKAGALTFSKIRKANIKFNQYKLKSPKIHFKNLSKRIKKYIKLLPWSINIKYVYRYYGEGRRKNTIFFDSVRKKKNLKYLNIKFAKYTDIETDLKKRILQSKLVSNLITSQSYRRAESFKLTRTGHWSTDISKSISQEYNEITQSHVKKNIFKRTKKKSNTLKVNSILKNRVKRLNKKRVSLRKHFINAPSRPKTVHINHAIKLSDNKLLFVFRRHASKSWERNPHIILRQVRTDKENFPLIERTKNVIHVMSSARSKDKKKSVTVLPRLSTPLNFLNHGRVERSSRLTRADTTLVLPSNLIMAAVTNSFDVVHSWFLPGLGIKMDCVPGRSTHHTFNFNAQGLFLGQCAEVCGRFHHHMPIRVAILYYEMFHLYYVHFLSKKLALPSKKTKMGSQ